MMPETRRACTRQVAVSVPEGERRISGKKPYPFLRSGARKRFRADLRTCFCATMRRNGYAGSLPPHGVFVRRCNEAGVPISAAHGET